jgi:hypothetical protein
VLWLGSRGSREPSRSSFSVQPSTPFALCGRMQRRHGLLAGTTQPEPGLHASLATPAVGHMEFAHEERRAPRLDGDGDGDPHGRPHHAQRRRKPSTNPTKAQSQPAVRLLPLRSCCCMHAAMPIFLHLFLSFETEQREFDGTTDMIAPSNQSVQAFRSVRYLLNTHRARPGHCTPSVPSIPS